ncbi:uncharacterized protein EDB91DRAFT_457888 [Suillus paluster]|uniref:uncharacterized protein n=1 Tax=Suillus paluster TaxID=48578 RepID=UPI001B8773B7|nr:uncharacterized protein EDB91DRAFT_457888 [Suillus paluster]KAG1738389.1 hypothetical protein EDB91DRAFT_457888 [Suillus paluster]
MLQITGTPFDFGSQRYEYPFPPTQGTSSDPFLPLSSSITITSPSNSLWPFWSPQVTKSFPLTAPPPRKARTHPKLRSVREPPVPPGLVNKRSAWSLSLQRQGSVESQQSDLSDLKTGGRGSCNLFTEVDAYPASDSEITMDTREGVADQKGLMTGGDHAPEVLAAGAPGSNGGHKHLDLWRGNPSNRGNVQGSSVGQILRIVAGRRRSWKRTQLPALDVMIYHHHLSFHTTFTKPFGISRIHASLLGDTCTQFSTFSYLPSCIPFP